MQLTCIIGRKTQEPFRRTILDNSCENAFEKLNSFTKARHHFKKWSPIAPVWYLIKMQVSCIIGSKTNKTSRKALKTHVDDNSEILLYKY